LRSPYYDIADSSELLDRIQDILEPGPKTPSTFENTGGEIDLFRQFHDILVRWKRPARVGSLSFEPSLLFA
jgi:hypothetical protein